MESRARFAASARSATSCGCDCDGCFCGQTPTDECMRGGCTLAELEDLDLFQCGLHVEMGDGGLANLGIFANFADWISLARG